MAGVDFESLAEKWPSSIVARKEVGKFSGGVISPKYLANLDSQGKGPDRRFRMGGRGVGYHVKYLILWLQERTEAI
jgi:hypothetical protein